MTNSALPDLSGHTILQIIPDLAAGGAERTTVEMAEAIRDAGGRALVASAGGRLESDLIKAGGELIKMPLARKNPLSLWRHARQLERLIEYHNVSLLHARSRAPAWSGLFAARKTNIPFITTYHGAYSGKSAAKIYYNSIMARGVRVIANSQWTADHVIATHRTDPAIVTTIPRGIDLKQFSPNNIDSVRKQQVAQAWQLKYQAGKLIILLAGRLTSWKGQLIAVNAIGLLNREQQSRLHLILAGDAQGRTGYVKSLEQAIADHELQDTVSIVGHCDDIAAAYDVSDIVLAPSVRPEAFGRVAAEASAMAKPVIISDHGGQREIILDGQTGLSAQPGHAQSLADSLTTLIEMSATERDAMGAAGQRHVRARFTKENLQQATLEVYQGAIGAAELVEPEQDNRHKDTAHGKTGDKP